MGKKNNSLTKNNIKLLVALQKNVNKMSSLESFLGFSDKKLKKEIGSVNRKYYNLIKIKEENGDKKLVVSNEETFKDILRKISKKESNEPVISLLYVTETEIGSVAFNPDSIEGLAYALKENKEAENLTGAIIISPYSWVPKRSTKEGEYAMQFLGRDPNKEINYDDIKKFGDIPESPFREKFIKKYILQGVNSLEDCLNIAKNAFKPLVNEINCPIHIFGGVNERKNRDEIKRDRRLKRAELAQRLKETEKKAEVKENYIGRLTDHLFERKEKLDLYRELKKKIKNPEDFKEIRDKFIEGPYFKTEEAQDWKYEISSKQTLYQIEKEIEKLKDKNTRNHILFRRERLQKELKELEEKIDSLEAASGNYAFTKITGVVPLTPLEAKMDHFFAKHELYTKYIIPPFIQKKKEKKLGVHSKRTKRIIIANYFNETKDEEQEGDILYSQKLTSDALDNNEVKVVVCQNPNIRSDNVKERDDSIAKLQLKHKFMQQYAMRGHPELLDQVPDMFITSHGKGFRIKFEQKYPENRIYGEKKETPKPTVYIKAPVMQSIDELLKCEDNDIRVWAVKRASNDFCAGALIQKIYADGHYKFQFFDYDDLLNIAKAKKQILAKEKYLKTLKDKEEKNKIKNEVKSLKESIRWPDSKELEKITVFGDTEFGSFNYPGGPSNYDNVDACIEYEKNRLPDVLILSELLHGPIKPIGYDPTRMSPLEAKIDSERELIKIVSSSKLSDKEKLDLVAEKQLEFLAKQGTNNFAKNLRDIKEKIILPYALPVLDKGGQVIHVGGNHAQATLNIDEGDLLCLLYGNDETKYRDTKQLQTVQATGQRYAIGHIRLKDGTVLYAAHKLRQGSDELVAAIKQTLKIQTDGEIVTFFDRHHPMVGVANKIIYVIAPGESPYNPYVDTIEKTASLHGLTSIYRDTRKNTQYKYSCEFEVVLDNTIQREEYMGKRINSFKAPKRNSLEKIVNNGKKN